LASRAPGKTAATSGSKVTTTLPFAYREAYGFGRARLKSYSGRTSSSGMRSIAVFLLFGFLMFFSLAARCSAGADQVNYAIALSEHYHEQAAPVRLAEEDEPLLTLRVPGVIGDAAEWITEHR
jgi:hypothetical protein